MVLDRIGDKWTVLVIGALVGGPLRFTELRQRVGGVAPKVLTQTLRALERDGLLTRTVYAQVPPRVDYALTDLGRLAGRADRRAHRLGRGRTSARSWPPGTSSRRAGA